MSTVKIENNKVIAFDNNEVACTVLSGSVLVYFVAKESGNDQTRMYVCEAFCGDEIPGFNYECFQGMGTFDNLSMYMQLISLNNAVIEEKENNDDIRNKFIDKMGISSPEKQLDEISWSELIGNQYADQIITNLLIIRSIKRKENKANKQLVEDISDFVSGSNFSNTQSESSGHKLYDAVNYLCSNLKIKCASWKKISQNGKNKIELEDIAAISGFSHRQIVLEKEWNKKDIGSFIAFEKETNDPVVILSKRYARYEYFESGMKKPAPLTMDVINRLSKDAFMLYRSFPAKSMTFGDLVSYIIRDIKPEEIVGLTILLVIELLMGCLLPFLSRQVYDRYIPGGELSGLFAFGLVIISSQVAAVSIAIVKRFLNFRVFKKIEYSAQAAMFERLFSARTGSIKKFESGELIQKTLAMKEVVLYIQNTLFLTVFAVIFSLFYLVIMRGYSASLCSVAIGILSIYLIVSLFFSWRNYVYSTKKRENLSRQNTTIYQFLNSIEKIISSNAGGRAFRKYFKTYANTVDMERRMEIVQNGFGIWDSLVMTGSTVLFYSIVSQGIGDISLGAFIAFTGIFGLLFSYIRMLVSSTIQLCEVIPSYRDVMSLLKIEPESNEENELIFDMKGKIEISGVTFGYEEGVDIIKDCSLSINPGEYIAIVGASGSGKSTLLKLLLGFENVKVGQIYYDDKELTKLNKTELRKHFGVVMQNSEIIPGTIYDNIVMANPNASYEEVKEAVKMAGFEEDVEKFPMGLGTGVNPVSGGISGGQIQRIAIARALLSRPDILFFDEATSALDNETQRIVIESIEKQNITKVVIAHRLSTIINCDRIIVLDNGRIAEEGSYDELMAMEGYFYRLAKRQIA